jgi:uncharacterized protein YdeI (BOF family)
MVLQRRPKNMRKLIAPLIFAALLLLTLALAAGCGGTTAAPALKNQAPKASQVTVQQVAKNPAAYDGQVVVTEGNYAVGYCSACFLLKDGVSALRVEVSERAPLPPESKLNSRMQVQGKIYVAQGSPNLVASQIVYK